MMRPLSRSLGVLCFSGALVVPFSARAQPPEQSKSQTPDPVAVALFEEARRLIVAGRCADAIPKLQESLDRARTVGALLNLADCYENTGRTASAWATFRTAAATATEAKDAKRSKYATDRANELEGKLARLTINVPAEAIVEGLELRRDGEPVDQSAWANAVPVDPGPHRIEATAPGRKPWSTTLDVYDAGARVDIPVLPTRGAGQPTDATTGTTGTSSQKRIGLVVGGAGGVAVAFGSIAGLLALANRNEAEDQCRSYPTICPADGSADAANDAAQTWATISTVSFVVGAAALAAGGFLFFSARDPQKAQGRVRWLPMSDGRSAGLVAGGAW